MTVIKFRLCTDRCLLKALRAGNGTRSLIWHNYSDIRNKLNIIETSEKQNNSTIIISIKNNEHNMLSLSSLSRHLCAYSDVVCILFTYIYSKLVVNMFDGENVL